MSLQRALFALVLLVLLAGLVPVGLALDRRLARTLESQAREDLALAPRILSDRWSAGADVRMMHAKDVAAVEGLAGALAAGDEGRAREALDRAPVGALESPILVDARGRSQVGPDPGEALIARTREGEMPVAVVVNADSLYVVALAPVQMDGRWTGAAGVSTPLDDNEAAHLAGLTRADVVLVGPSGNVAGTTLADPGAAGRIARNSLEGSGDVVDLRDGSTRLIAVSGDLGGVARVVFVRDLDRELEVVPALRRIAAISIALSLVFALLVGAGFAGRLARPVRALAEAADRFAAGDLEAPLERSGISEVRQLGETFDVMRRRLATRVQDLEDANRELEDRQARLAILQGELVQRDRLAAAGRLLAQLAHEIRNPVASVRNCLELLRREVADDPEARAFADMAIDELLRMHELAEQMIDLHRPPDPTAKVADAVDVALRVAQVAQAGWGPDSKVDVRVHGDAPVPVEMTPSALQQVLTNLVQNAREAVGEGGHIDVRVATEAEGVVIEVADTGSGISADALPRIFDPFFTTKSAVRGVGLGLFTAEGMVRTAGGRISAENRVDGPGVRFRVELPAVSEAAAAASGGEGVAEG